MASWLSPLLTTSLDVNVRLLDGTSLVDETRKHVEVKMEKDRREMCPVYLDGESVQGEVVIRSRDGKKWAHDGLRIEFVGSIGEISPAVLYLHGSVHPDGTASVDQIPRAVAPSAAS